MLNKIKKVTLCALVLIGMESCMSLKRADSDHKITPRFPVSGSTELFLQQYAALPSEKGAVYDDQLAQLAHTYTLKTLPDKTYALCGFIRTDSLFNPTPLLQQGISFAPPIGNMRTTCIPLSQLEYFFNQPHILYFESSRAIPPILK